MDDVRRRAAANWVTSSSWTLSQLPWRNSTWMSGLASFHPGDDLVGGGDRRLLERQALERERDALAGRRPPVPATIVAPSAARPMPAVMVLVLSSGDGSFHLRSPATQAGCVRSLAGARSLASERVVHQTIGVPRPRRPVVAAPRWRSLARIRESSARRSAFPGHAGRLWSLARWRSLARIGESRPRDDRRSSLHRSAQQSGHQPALDDGEECEARDRRQQRGGGELAECTWPSAPTKLASVSGSVSRSGDWISTKAKKNSFQEEMNVNSAVATSPGASSGRMMLRKDAGARRHPSLRPLPGRSGSR